jgi:DNA-binding transcriptional LysR family regulator
MLEVRKLEMLVAVVDHGSFSIAAEQLHVSQPAISHAVTTLERQIGTPLLLRGRGGVTATEAGALLADHARTVLDRLSLAAEQLQQHRDHEHARVRVAAFGSALATVVPDTLHKLRRSQPDIRVEATEAPTPRQLQLVATGQVDLAIGYDDPERPVACDELIRTDLFTEPLLLALPPGHRHAGRDSLTLPELADERWLTPDPDHLLVRACHRAGFEPNIVATARDALAIRGLILSADVVTLTPQLLDPALPPVITIPLDTPVQRQVFAVTADPTSPPATTMLQALTTAAIKHSGRQT